MWLDGYAQTLLCVIWFPVPLCDSAFVQIKDNPSSSFTFTSLTTKQFTMQATQNKRQGRVILSQEIQWVGILPQFGALLEPLGCHSSSKLRPSEPIWSNASAPRLCPWQEYYVPQVQNKLAQRAAVVTDFSCRLTEGEEDSFSSLFIPSVPFPLPKIQAKQ